MPRYADPARCPDCGDSLPEAPGRCPTCGLPLTGPLASELLRTLRRADDLVVQLRDSVAAVPVAEPVTAGAVASGAVAAGSPVMAPPPAAQPLYPPPVGAPVPASASRRTGLQALSVPRILLGLGAACLLVAAVIFLAVAWSWLGIGGRTVVLVAATVATGILGVHLGRRDLRIGAEALTAVSLGLLVLDLVGARDAGWFGDLTGASFAVLVGAALVAAGGGLLVALKSDQRRLVVPQLLAVLGAAIAMVAVHDLTEAFVTTLVSEILLIAVVVKLCLGRGVPFVVGLLAGLGALWWVGLVVHGLAEAVPLGALSSTVTLRDLWVDGDGVALAAAVLLALVPIAVVPRRGAMVQAAVAISATLATVVLVLPALDNGPSDAAGVWLVTLVVWTAIVHVVRRPGAPAPLTRVPYAVLVPLAQSSLVVAAFLAGLLGRAAVNVLGTGATFAESAGVRLDVVAEQAHPVLLVPLAIALLGAAYVVLPSRRLLPQVAASVVGLAVIATLAQYAVQLALVVGVLAAAGAVALLGALRRHGSAGDPAWGAAIVLMGAAAVVALPSAALTAAALGVVLVAAVLLLVLGAPVVMQGRAAVVGVPRAVVRVAGAVVPLAWAGVVWTTSEAGDLRFAWCAVVVMAVVGVLAIAVPRIEIEVAATLATILSAPASVAAATDQSVSLALHLTLAGALLTASSLVHRDRRVLAVPGGLLLAAATWVRLADLGVTAPEAYTLPTALVLLAVGLDRMRRDDAVPTAVVLTPGLLLATVPSLLWALGDPISLRALLLGAACLVLVLGGAAARWSAPVVVGALVGAVLVARELAPYASQTPQWVVIGLAGTALIVVGVTWEKRVQDVQRVGGLLARLR